MATITTTTTLPAATTTAINTILTHNTTSTTPQPPPTYNFSFLPFLRTQGLASLASTTPVCPAWQTKAGCPLGRKCPNRHPTPTQSFTSGYHHFGRNNDTYVCKHWLKGLCKKGDACDYLHEYNLRKMSECQFWNVHGYCQNGDECLYVHVKEGSKLPMCEDYNKGFCAAGPRCTKRHVRRKLCEFYMAGFCPDGPECRNGVHLKTGGKIGESEEERKRSEKNKELERREEESKKEFGWRSKQRGGRSGGRWREKGGRNDRRRDG
ncbi:mRNA 3'-end-processing protein YTH1 [Cyphellophora attinorum]|uniref:mRNA 3'-end-processing protein n=1 Tax=Cyphellophora attinorum TaxID=1664694 RepID=A0A0N0NRV1_9EURO|nr:mRNA 3'-end-processing protein YTH1 [Phialophora attinorum]KPI45259.1 mRNA 3'-end-processing protein YTH1 [Phialophora attinorum]